MWWDLLAAGVLGFQKLGGWGCHATAFLMDLMWRLNAIQIGKKMSLNMTHVHFNDVSTFFHSVSKTFSLFFHIFSILHWHPRNGWALPVLGADGPGGSFWDIGICKMHGRSWMCLDVMGFKINHPAPKNWGLMICELRSLWAFLCISPKNWA